MTSSKAPWDEMKTPDSDYTVRYVTSPGDVALCWGKNIQGQCLFIVQLKGEHAEQFRKNAANVTNVNGIEIDLRHLPEPGRQGLILILEKYEDRDLFHGLCQALIKNLKGVASPTAALGITLNHIKRWKAFLAIKRSRVLSAEEVRGLFAELSFLRFLKAEHMTDAEAVQAWCGPDSVHHDFIFGDTAVEIKSLSGRDRSVVRVSSEDQLETVSERLFLCVYRLREALNGDSSQSLNDLVSAIGDELNDADAIEDYWRKLAIYGYIEMSVYETPKFLVNGRSAYGVSEGFPRLIRSDLPDGVVNVNYNLQLEKISSFECNPIEIWEN